LQAELLFSLALVMVSASVVLAVVLFLHDEARLRDLLGRALLAEARAEHGPTVLLLPGMQWWRVPPDASLDELGASQEGLDEATRDLGERAHREGVPLVQPGAPWDPIRLAAPQSDGNVVLARLPVTASWRLRARPLAVLLAVLIADVVVFAVFGMSLLRRRIVLPLRRLAGAARSIADGAFEARVSVEGPRESAEVALAFNEMTEALQGRTRALEEAVVDLRETREGLERVQRLAALGRLAAGVAHEVGNPIGAILALLDLVARRGGLSQEGRQHLERAAEQGERVRRILRQLLEFSKPPQISRMALDLAKLAQETVSLVSTQPRYQNIRFALERPASLPLARGDPGAVAQILLNLVLNAADAVAEASNPSVRLLLRKTALKARQGESRQTVLTRRDADAVECVVADNGHGVADEDRDRIFDPFFTTKPPGEGTGLGLANSMRLAEQLGGKLELVEPPAGAHAAFALRLPREATATPACPEAPLGEGSSRTACEVRDEPKHAEFESAPRR
jgi:signal transduction histidine kinase